MESIEKTLYKLETRLLEPDIRKSPKELKKLLADDFMEIGSTAQVYDRQTIIEALSHEKSIEITISDFNSVQMSSDIVLVTYRATVIDFDNETRRQSIRSSIWKKSESGWVMSFHQGTPVTNTMHI